MTISELIAMLESIKKTHGDIFVEHASTGLVLEWEDVTVRDYGNSLAHPHKGATQFVAQVDSSGSEF